jgi:hypothetical protein
MHPDLLRALAKTRHEELLARRQNPGHQRVRRVAHSPRFVRSRKRLGSLLIWVGARLIGDQPATVELAQK